MHISDMPLCMTFDSFIFYFIFFLHFIDLNDDFPNYQNNHVSHGCPDKYKLYLSYLTDEEVIICDKVFKWKKADEIAYENSKVGGFLTAPDLLTLYPENELTNWVSISVTFQLMNIHRKIYIISNIDNINTIVFLFNSI